MEIIDESFDSIGCKFRGSPLSSYCSYSKRTYTKLIRQNTRVLCFNCKIHILMLLFIVCDVKTSKEIQTLRPGI